MIFDWTDCAAILSARNVLEGETFRAFVINELTEEVLEQHAFTPLKNRLGQYEWVSDFCRFINNRSNVVQAGLWENGKWIIHGSSYQNRIWSTLKDIRVFTNSPDKDNWIKSTAIHSQVSLKATDKVHVVVRSERSGRRFELVEFRPLAKRLAASQWRADLVNHINTHSQYIKAGSSDDSKHVITTSAQTDGNCIWLPKGSGITASWYICENTAVADVVSGRNAFEKERITVFVVDDVSDQERDKITLETPAADTEMRTWTTALCKKVNAKSEYVKAGTYNESGQFSVISGTSFKNRIWTEHRDIRVFTTCPRLDNWEPIKPLLTDEVMTLDERVIVKVRSAATGRLCETLVFAPNKDRLKPALWMRDLSTLINEQSLYLRAGQANAEKELIETIADVYKSFIWAPKNSRLNVTWERCQLQPTAVIRSQRNPVENEKVRLFVLDEASGKELERREYTVPKAHTSNSYDWVEGFCNLINSNSKLVRIGESFKEGKLEVLRSGFKNRIWPLGKDLRVFTTSIGLENWVAARDFSFETDLKANERIVVHLRSELTGYLYERYSFSPTLKDKKATAADWTKALCEKLNKECIYLKAGWKNEEKQIIEPVADHRKNVIWVPVNSGLTVEVLNIADKTLYAAPIEVQAGVDPQTGKAHVKIPFGSVVANEGQGPSLDMGLCWTKDTGWDLYGFSFMFVGESTPSDKTVLMVSPGGNFECFKSTQLQNTDVLSFQSFKLKKNNDVAGTPWEVVHKNGMTERLGKEKELKKKWHGVRGYLPTIIKNASGYQMDLKWKDLDDDDVTKPLLTMLESIVCNVPAGTGKTKEIKLFESKTEKKTLFCTLYPGNEALQTVFEIALEDPRNDSIDAFDSNEFWSIMCRFSGTFPFGNVLSIKRTHQARRAFLDIKYIQLEDRRNGTAIPFSAITHVRSQVAVEEFLYAEKKEGLELSLTDPDTVNPAVRSASQAPEKTGLGIVGPVFDVRRTHVVSVYKRREIQARETVRTYKYEKQKTIVSTTCGDQASTTTLHFSGDGVLTKQEEQTAGCTRVIEYDRSEDKKQGTQTLKTKVTRGKQVQESTAVVDAEGNLIKSVEDGITREWTYYRGEPKITPVTELRRVQHMSSLAHGVGFVVDYLNPIGWCLNIFASRGLTWGTEEVTTEWESRYDTKHEKDVFNLPVVLECPGDSYYFKVYVESEKVYVEKDGVRTDLSWSFYSYTLLPERNGCDNAIKPATKLTVLYPKTTDNKKLDKFIGRSMSLEENSYVTNVNDTDFGRLLEQAHYRVDQNGDRIPSSRHHTHYTYAVKDGVLTTTLTEESGPSGSNKSVTRIASEMVSGLKAHATDWLESQTKWSFDALGRVTSQIENAGAKKEADRLTTRYQHHTSLKGYSITTVTPENEQSRVEYDQSGNETKRWARGAGFIGWRLLSSVQFDDADRPVVRTELDYLPDGTLFSKQQWRLHYDGWGELKETELPDGGRTYCEYDLSDPDTVKTTEYTKVDGKAQTKVVSTFDKHGNQTRLELQNGSGAVQAWTEHSYDAGDRLIKSKDNHGVEVAYAYDTRDRLRNTTRGGVVTRVDYPSHSSFANKLEVGEAGKKEGFVELGSRTISALSRVTGTKVGGRQVEYEYDGVSPLGKRTTAYPALDDAFAKHSVEHSLKTNARCGTVEQQYVVAGAKYSVTDEYTLRGVPLSFSNAFGQKTVYHYDRAGRRVKAVSDEVHTTFTYDGFGVLTGETVWHIAAESTARISYTYNALGQETGRSFVIDDKHKLNLKYTYEKGRIKTAQVLKDTSSVRKEEYAYDAQGRLQTWICEGSERPTDCWLQEQLKKQSFTYDVLGNIQTCISETTGTKKSNTATYAYDETDRVQLKKITHSYSGCTAVELEYDSEGRLKKNPVNKLALHYDTFDQQVGSGKSHLAYYDNYGRRVLNEADYYREWFHYDGDLPYARDGFVLIGDKKTCDKRRTVLLNQSGSCLAQRQTLSGGGDLEINTFELKDVQGSVIASWRIGKEGFSWLSYEPFGYRPSKADDLHWLGFTGQPLDHQSGAVYHFGNGYRTYNPLLKVFHAPDDTSFSPFGRGGTNWYGYCNGDPRNLIDPTGHAVMVSQSTRLTHAPLLDDPIINTIFTGALMAAAAVLTGGGALAVAAGVGFAIASTGFSVGAILAREHDPDLASLFDWLSFTADMVPAGGGRAMSKAMSRGARGARPAYGAARAGRAARRPIVARGGNMRNVQKLRDGGGYMFEDRYKNALRLNIDAHGPMIGKTSYPVIGNHPQSPEELLALLKRRKVDLSRYAHIRLIVCDSATGGPDSYAQRLATLSGIPVKGFEGEVFAQVNAAGALTQHASRRGMKVTTSLRLPFAEESVIFKKNPFKPWNDPHDFISFRYSPVHFKP